jgi:hypothetical protein
VTVPFDSEHTEFSPAESEMAGFSPEDVDADGEYEEPGVGEGGTFVVKETVCGDFATVIVDVALVAARKFGLDALVADTEHVPAADAVSAPDAPTVQLPDRTWKESAPLPSPPLVTSCSVDPKVTSVGFTKVIVDWVACVMVRVVVAVPTKLVSSTVAVTVYVPALVGEVSESWAIPFCPTYRMTRFLPDGLVVTITGRGSPVKTWLRELCVKITVVGCLAMVMVPGV